MCHNESHHLPVAGTSEPEMLTAPDTSITCDRNRSPSAPTGLSQITRAEPMAAPFDHGKTGR